MAAVAIRAWRVGYRRMGRRLLIAAVVALGVVAGLVTLAATHLLSVGGAAGLVGIALFGLVFVGRRIIQAEKVATRCRLDDEGLHEEVVASPGDRRQVAFAELSICRTGADPSPPHTAYVRVVIRGHDEEVYVTADAEGFERFVAALREKAPAAFE